MKTTKDMIEEDWERLALLDKIYVMEYEEELYQQLKKEINEMEYATVVIGKPRKQGKFKDYARISVKGRSTSRLPKRINI